MHLTAEDGNPVRAEVAAPEDADFGVVLCHPHTLHGGNMQSMVIGALWQALDEAGQGCVRFNFRGVEGDRSAYTGGDLERLDVKAAYQALAAGLAPGTPMLLAGWSFGGDVSLAVRDLDHVGWVAIAPPLRFLPDELALTARDERPKRVFLAQHDQFRPPDEVAAEFEGWKAATVEVIGGADHFFIGRSDQLTGRVMDALRSLAGSS